MPLKLILFDFDQTLASIHLYHKLDGLLQCNPFDNDASEDEQIHKHATAQLEQMPHVDANEIFGGADRIKYLREILQELKDEGVSLMIISHGYTEVVEAAMEKGGMPSFEKVYGANHPELSSVDCDKTRLTAQLIKKMNLHPTECVLVDDDPRNLIPAKQYQVCPTLFVWSRGGISESELRSLCSRQVCPQKQREYSLVKTFPIPDHAASVVGGYYELSGTVSLESAVAKANAVPPHHRFEPVKIVRTLDEGAHVMYCSVEHLLPFYEMLKKYCTQEIDLSIPDKPPHPLIVKEPSPPLIDQLNSQSNNRFIEVRSSGSGIKSALEQLTSSEFQESWRIRHISTALHGKKPVLRCICCRLSL